MLQLQVNGQTVPLDKPASLAHVLRDLGHQGERFAVAVDGEFVPRFEYENVIIKGGESLEVLSPMQGG